MGRFKSAPTALIQPSTLEPQIQAFITGAATRFPTATVTAATPKGPPWNGLNPRAVARQGINLRLNEWELAVLRHASERDGRSIQQVLKDILTPALRAYVAAEDGGTGTGTGTGTTQPR